MGQTQTTQGGNAVANLPSRREAQYYHFKQFTSSLGLTSEKYSINIENSPPLNLTVHFKSEYQGEVLPKAVVEAEYKKFLRLKEKGRLSSFLPLDLGEVD